MADRIGNETKHPTELQLRAWSRYGDQDGAEVRVVSEAGAENLRVMIRYGRHRVYLQQRTPTATIQVEEHRGPGGRYSTRTTDWQQAVQIADNRVREKALADHLDHEEQTVRESVVLTGQGAPLEACVESYLRAKRGVISDTTARNLERTAELLVLEKGVDWSPQEIQNAHAFVSWWVDLRTKTIHRLSTGRRSGKIRVHIAVAELKDFNTVLNSAVRTGLLTRNPLADMDFEQVKREKIHALSRQAPDRREYSGVVEHREEWSLEMLGRLINPPIHPVTGAPLLDDDGRPVPPPVRRCDAKDGGSRLDFVVRFLARYGRRPSELYGTRYGGEWSYPRVRDVLLAPDAVRRELERAPNHRVSWAEVWPHGAFVSWRNKTSLWRVLPMDEVVRSTVERWLSEHPAADDPYAPLLPSIRNPRQPLAKSTLRRWIRNAIEAARSDAEAMGLDPDRYMPWLDNSLLGGLRPTFRTTMTGLGWDGAKDQRLHADVPPLDKHALFIGGWNLGKNEVQEDIYRRLVPQYLLGVVQWRHAAKVQAEYEPRVEEGVARLWGQGEA